MTYAITMKGKSDSPCFFTEIRSGFVNVSIADKFTGGNIELYVWKHGSSKGTNKSKTINPKKSSNLLCPTTIQIRNILLATSNIDDKIT